MKYLSIVKYALLLLSLVTVVVGVTEISLDAMLLWAGIMLVLTIAMALIMPLFGVFENPQSAKGSLVGLGLLVLLFVVSYLLSTADPITMAGGEIFDNKVALLYSDTALWSTYISFSVAAISIIGSEVYNLFK